MSLTIGETIQELHESLRDYIEATYHVSHPLLVEQRRALLDEVGVIHQRPFLESTPRYKAGQPFEKLGLDPAVLKVFHAVSKAEGTSDVLIHNPPYHHQSESVRLAMAGRSLVVMTGTGSGKTECFLLPILGKLAQEASDKSKQFAKPAVRAIVLYPMNALVNDQLGRLRLLFGDKRVVDIFNGWSGRPTRFARYTSRTLYPGVREPKKDQVKLSPIGKFYVHTQEIAEGPPSLLQAAAAALVSELRKRGKWPAKSDLLAWYGAHGSRWFDAKTGEYKRCVALPNDSELFTRHEVQAAPPDILVTNYSMLEYMLIRPLERSIFDMTREWLESNPTEKLLLVIDEAHLYRGAAGAEVALLIRRLRTRLNIRPERLQVICTSASFQNAEYAKEFGAQLTGKSVSDFEKIEGSLDLRPEVERGNYTDAQALSNIDINKFYAAETDAVRLDYVRPFLKYRGISESGELQRLLYDSLRTYGPMSRLINQTMQEARPVSYLSGDIFENVDGNIGQRAVTSLIALGSLARKSPSEPGLLPCRVHSFHRGLAGLWVCMDSQCSELPQNLRGGPVGKLYSQPIERCNCGARILELFTCRNCGTAYARAYTDNIDAPNFLWAEPGGSFRTQTGQYGELELLDLLLEEPNTEDVELAEFDLVTGRLNPLNQGARTRKVYLRASRIDPPNTEDDEIQTGHRGEFKPCAVCDERAGYGRSSVQDHQTKGDQPFAALVAKQLQVQPPNACTPTPLAPLRGRKVLIFSDSRQTAARLAPNIQLYSTNGALRPLIVYGYGRLLNSPILRQFLCLEDLYFAVLLAAKHLGVRLRPELTASETFAGEDQIVEALSRGALGNDNELLTLLLQFRNMHPPASLLRSITQTLTDRYYGLESLALASVVERSDHTTKIHKLPDISGVATTPAEKVSLARMWLRCWNRTGFWLSRMPQPWFQTYVKTSSGKFTNGMKKILNDRNSQSAFEKKWVPELLKIFADNMGGSGKFRLRGADLSLQIDGSWSYCNACKTTQRPLAGRSTCVNCGLDKAVEIDPDQNQVFMARKGYFRASTLDALRRSISPMALIAAEHTAQLNSAQGSEVFSKAEEHELLFQDVNLGAMGTDQERPAIDVLSCTTTMEVGIDIGTLSGVALRNMPPARSNYQQRAGRAGRRGNAVATVTAFGSADSHDEHYFLNPDQMIRGPVKDPKLTLDNRDIVRRHVTAFLLQRYHQDRLPVFDPESPANLFSVLGTVNAFKNQGNVLNRIDFEQWLRGNEKKLKDEIESWIPLQLSASDRSDLLNNLVEETLDPVDKAIEFGGAAVVAVATAQAPTAETLDNETSLETAAEVGEEIPATEGLTDNLLDRLLYKGVLPRYAFPTDVATFHVFDRNLSSNFKHAYQFTPSQGLSIALSQYAPGKEVWIANKLWTSGAVYSPIKSDRYDAWERRKLYFECENCHYAKTIPLEEGVRGEKRDCDACGGVGTFGTAKYWLRPPGFAHSVSVQEGTTPDDQPERSYATRAKLMAPSPADPSMWNLLNAHLRAHHTRQHLLVTNRGPREEGYTYCVKCGLIEATCIPEGKVLTAHPKPFPDTKEQMCPGGGATKGMVLGTDFITDVLLISLRVEAPILLRPDLLATEVALRTIAEALTMAACGELDLEASELQAEFRPALTTAGRDGMEAEIYVYDTLSGGAGFAKMVGALGLTIFQGALDILENCPDSCDRSCYRCLRSYKNKFEHELLDRHVGVSLLKYLLNGTVPNINEDRLGRSTDVLFNDLERNISKGMKVERNKQLTVNGLGSVIAPILLSDGGAPKAVIALHSPLMPDTPPSQELADLKEFSLTVPLILVDELVVRRNLPRATADIIRDVSYG